MKILVKDMNEAWKVFNRFFDWDLHIDKESSDNAGYKIYRDETEYLNYVCDLNDRLEVNQKDGSTVNIWVEKEEKPTQPTNLFEHMLQTITLEQFASLNVQLCNINNNSLFWVNSAGQLFPYNQRVEAVNSQLTILNTSIEG